jgi:hypothetical protein
MLDSDIILGISARLEGCSEYAHGILSQEWEHWPVGTPLVFPDTGLKNSGGQVHAATLFTPSQRVAGCREEYAVPTSLICPVGLKSLAKNHKVLTISEFDLGKMDRLSEYVRDVGGISFVIDFVNGFKAFPKQIRKIEKLFEYAATFYYNCWGSKYLEGDDDKYVGVVTFLDIPYCLPLFNMRRVHGLGLSFCGATTKASKNYGQLHRVFRLDHIFSNYLDNIFVIDAIDVNKISPLDSNVYKELVKMTAQELPVMPAKSKTKEAAANLREQAMQERYKKYKPPMEWKTQSVELYHDGQAVFHTTTDGPVEINTDETPDPAPDEESSVNWTATQYEWHGAMFHGSSDSNENE